MEKTIPSRVRGTGLQPGIGTISGQAMVSQMVRYEQRCEGKEQVGLWVSEEEFQVQGTVLAKALGGNVPGMIQCAAGSV